MYQRLKYTATLVKELKMVYQPLDVHIAQNPYRSYDHSREGNVKYRKEKENNIFNFLNWFVCNIAPCLASSAGWYIILHHVWLPRSLNFK